MQRALKHPDFHACMARLRHKYGTATEPHLGDWANWLAKGVRDVECTYWGRMQSAGVPDRCLDVLKAGTQKSGDVRAAWRALCSGAEFLLLRGSVGTGKSVTSAWLLGSWVRAESLRWHNRRFRMGATSAEPDQQRFFASELTTGARWIKASKFCSLAPWSKEHDDITACRFLVLDDAGIEPKSQHQRIEDLLCTRYDNQTKTVCTTNLSDDQFRQAYGARVSSRLGHVGEAVTFSAMMRPRMTV